MVITLPYPPSTNRLWRYTQRGVYRTAKYMEYIAECQGFYMHQGASLDAPVKVSIRACPPDKRIRDLDNLLKSLLDVCVKLGCLTDDKWIHDLSIRWDRSIEVGVEVTMELME